MFGRVAVTLGIGPHSSLFCRPLAVKNPKFCLFCDFGILWCRQLAAIWYSLTQVHNYKPSSIQRYPNRFGTPPLWRNRHTNSDVQKHDGQTDRQTEKKLIVFGAAAGEIRAPPHLASCTSKTLWGSTHSFPASSAENFGEPDRLSVKAP